jgi:hypothetical protein
MVKISHSLMELSMANTAPTASCNYPQSAVMQVRYAEWIIAPNCNARPNRTTTCTNALSGTPLAALKVV